VCWSPQAPLPSSGALAQSSGFALDCSSPSACLSGHRSLVSLVRANKITLLSDYFALRFIKPLSVSDFFKLKTVISTNAKEENVLDKVYFCLFHFMLHFAF
jgi:hypothetical protein